MARADQISRDDIERKLREVEALPTSETLRVLPDAPAATSATGDEAGDQRTVG